MPERRHNEVGSQFVYRILGVIAFNRLINPNYSGNNARWAQWARAKEASRGIFHSELSRGADGTPESMLYATIEKTRINERSHLAGLLGRNLSVSLIVAGPWWFHAVNAFEAVLEHGYPIALQHYNRNRCRQALARIAQRRAMSASVEEVPVVTSGQS